MEQATVHARNATESMRRGNWQEAEHQWELLLKIQPESAAAHANLGSVQLQLKKLPAARENLEKAVKLRPSLASAWMNLGMLYNDQNTPMLAISALSRAVHEDPTDPRLHNALAIVLKRLGWTGAAEQELQKAIDLTPEYAEAHFNLALLYLEQRPPATESARRHYSKARDLGSPVDSQIENQLKAAPAVVTPDDAGLTEPISNKQTSKSPAKPAKPNQAPAKSTR